MLGVPSLERPEMTSTHNVKMFPNIGDGFGACGHFSYEAQIVSHQSIDFLRFGDVCTRCCAKGASLHWTRQ